MFKKIRKQTWSTLFVSGSTAIFAIISLVSVFITINTWQIQREAARPYFSFKESPQIELTHEVNFEFKFSNVGNHPATELTSKTLIFQDSLSEDPILIDTYSVVNDIPQNTATSLIMQIDSNRIDPRRLDLNAYYIVISLDYRDPILNEKYHQDIYIKWPGMDHGRIQPLIHMEAGEKEKVMQYIHGRNLYP